jgi:hypothetical protein
VEYTTCYFEGGRVKTPVYQLSDLGADDIVVGPAIIIDKTSTIVIEPLCKAKITNWGDISIEVQSARKASIGYTPHTHHRTHTLAPPHAHIPPHTRTAHTAHGDVIKSHAVQDGFGSDPAVAVQQPVHEHRRADGQDAPAHLHLDQHQGAP